MYSVCMRLMILIRNDNPDKGTETKLLHLSSNSVTIRNDNPDKGTETP